MEDCLWAIFLEKRRIVLIWDNYFLLCRKSPIKGLLIFTRGVYWVLEKDTEQGAPV